MGNDGVAKSDKLGLEVIIIRVASSSELKAGHEDQVRYAVEIANWTAIFAEAEKQLDEFIREVEAISNEEWESDNWSWALNPGSIPHEHYLIKGQSTAEILEIARQEKKSRVEKVEAGGLGKVMDAAQNADVTAGPYGKVVVSIHSDGPVHYPNGFSDPVEDFARNIGNIAGCAPNMVVACNQIPTNVKQPLFPGSTATRNLLYEEYIIIKPTIRFDVGKKAKCKVALGLLGVQKGFVDQAEKLNLDEKF